MRVLGTLLLLLMTAGCGGIRPAAPLTSHETETYAVYSSLLEQAFSGASGDTVVVRDRTALGMNNEFPLSDSTLAYIKQNIPGLGPDILRSFLAVNPSPQPVRNGFNDQVRVLLITRQESEEIFGKGDWEEFARRYPGANGITAFSAVGFSDRMDQALVYAGRTTGRLAGVGYYLLMVKKNGRWTIAGRATAWKS